MIKILCDNIVSHEYVPVMLTLTTINVDVR